MCALFQVGPFLQQPILWKKCTVLSFLSPCRVLDQSSSLFLGFWTHSSSPACARAHSQWPSLPERWAINQSPKIHGIRVWTRDTTPTCGRSSSSQVFLFFSMSYNKICIIKSTTFSFSKISIIFTSQKKLPGAFDRGQERCLHLSPLSPILQWFRKKRQFYNFLPRNLYVHDQGVFFETVGRLHRIARVCRSWATSLSETSRVGWPRVCHKLIISHFQISTVSVSLKHGMTYILWKLCRTAFRF